MSESTQPHYSILKRFGISFDLLVAIGLPVWVSWFAFSFVDRILVKNGLVDLGTIIQIVISLTAVKILIGLLIFYLLLYGIGFVIKRLILRTDQSFQTYFDATLDDVKTATFLVYVGFVFFGLGVASLWYLSTRWNGAFWTLFGVWGVIFYLIGIGWSCCAFLPGIWHQEKLTLQLRWLSGGTFMAGVLIILAIVYCLI